MAKKWSRRVQVTPFPSSPIKRHFMVRAVVRWMGDTGLIVSDTGKLQVTDTLKKLGDVIVHQATVLEGEVRVPLLNFKLM